jgi:hypothetical protein
MSTSYSNNSIPQATNEPDPWLQYCKFNDMYSNALSASISQNAMSAAFDAETKPRGENTAETGANSHPLETSIDELNMNRLSLNAEETPADPTNVKRHGACLALSDHDRIKTFIGEFLQRGLVPYAERTIKILNEQIQSKKSILKSFGIPRKFFGGSSSTSSSTAAVSLSGVKTGSISTVSTGGLATPATATNNFVTTNDELQLRRLADLAFMFRMYDLAYSSYHSAKKEFSNFLSSNNSQTSSEQIIQMKMYLAGALEMATVASFMQNFANDPAFLHSSYSSSSLASSANTSTNSSGLPVSSSNSSISSLAASVTPLATTHNKTYQLQYIDEAIGLYVNECKNVYGSVRAVLLSTEALRATSLFLKAAYQFINLANDETDVRTALFLEQAALCYLAQPQPLIRKYSFFMALAGHRFNKAGQVISFFLFG